MITPSIDLKKLEEDISIFSELDCNNLSIAELMNYLNPIFHGFAVASIKFSYPIAIYRSVQWNKIPEEIKYLSYPPSENIFEYGRINDIGESYFYGCFNWEPTLFELGLKENDTVTTSMWQTKDDILITPIGYTQEAFYQLNAIRLLPEEVKPKNIPILMRDNNIIVDEFLSKTFTKVIKSKNEYKLTIAIAKYLLSNKMIDGILYPTIAMNGLSENIVLHTATVDKKLIFNEARFMKVGRKDGIFYKTDLSHKTISINKNGFINWQVA